MVPSPIVEQEIRTLLHQSISLGDVSIAHFSRATNPLTSGRRRQLDDDGAVSLANMNVRRWMLTWWEEDTNAKAATTKNDWHAQ
jgi:hypothetical protein